MFPETPRAPLERDDELKCLAEALASAREDRGGRILVVGPPGIGKTRLLHEAAGMAAGEGMSVLTARAGALEQDYPFGLALQLLEARFVRAPAAERTELLRGRAGMARALLDDDATAVVNPTGADEFALVHGLYWAIVNLAERQPLALLVDDVHWADELSLRFLHYLWQRLDDLPVCLVMAFRRPDDGLESARLASIADVGDIDYLHPAELSREAVRTMLSLDAPTIADRPEMADAAWRATRGNPFLVRELVAALRDEPERWRSTAAEELVKFAPEAVTRSVVQRLTHLGQDAFELARACAVLGDSATMTMAAGLARLDADRVGIAVGRLIARGILAGAETTEFHHPVIHAAVYDDIPVPSRTRAHSEAARLLRDAGAGSQEIARHLALGTPTLERWAHDTLHDAGRAASARGAPKVAVSYLTRAVDWSPPARRSSRLLLDLGLAEAACGRTTSLRRFEEALAHVEDDGERARTLQALGRTLHRYGRHREAVDVFRLGTELFARDAELLMAFHAGWACSSNFVADGRTAAHSRLEALAAPVTQRTPVSDAERNLLAALAVQRGLTSDDLTSPAEIATLALQGHALMDDPDSDDDVGTSLIVVTLLFCERETFAANVVDRVLAHARQRGSGLALAEASFLQAMVLHRIGRVHEARSAAELAIEGTATGWHATVPAPHGFLVDCLIETGDLTAAEKLIRSGEMEPARPEASGLNAWFHWSRGRLKLACHDAAGALSDFVAAGHDLEPFTVGNPAVLPWRSHAAEAAFLLEDPSGAHGFVDAEIALAREKSLHGALGAALRIKARGQAERAAIESLTESIDVLEKSARELELAKSLLDLGRVLRKGGQRVAARDPLRRAMDIAYRCGAVVLQNAAREELLSAGARPRRASITGSASLTGSERRIAELAAHGHSNRVIAETLLLTKNTVDWHLRSVFRKLGVSRREDVGAALSSFGHNASESEWTSE
ncbi:AAA family ATPase [Mycobacterium sp. E1747]|uniref:ATP-binding protein n=1 Tax=Mycobacterium sp. E1747 TaxID=1834128 RepID=UPI0009EE86C0|nr:LuxR family transcriptional regulator [Mycobacterium sp. E1747]